MSQFWTFARGMLRYRAQIALALAMASLSALSLSTGIFATTPMIEMVGGKGKTLPQIANDLNTSWAQSRFSFVHRFHIPDSVIAALPKSQDAAMYWVLGTVALMTAISSIGYFLHGYVTLSIVNRMLAELRHRVFHAVLRAPLSRAISGGSADSVSRIINDTSVVAGGFALILSKATIQVFKGFAAFMVALVVEWRVTVLCLVFLPPIYTIIRKLGKRVRRAAGAALSSQARLYGITTQALQALKVVKVSTSERIEGSRFHRTNKDVLRELNRARIARSLASPLVELLNVLMVCGLVLVAAMLIARKQLDPEDAVTALIALGIAGTSFKPLTGIIGDVQNAEPAAERVAELLNADPEPGHGLNLPKLPRHHASIELRNVTFTYPNASQPALRDISLTIPHGQRVAIVGPNGSGKTTLLALVPRLYDPQHGSVIIDDRDVRDVSVRSLRSQVGVVTQETVLFNDTIRANIAYAADNATESRILDAAQRARAHDFIMATPQGYDTIVAEGGLSLSGGQRQRISIARAILRDPAILVLDEATSMIDTESERAISEALTEFSKGRTSLIVAHRLSTIVNADTIVVMDQGAIIDRGTHAELLNRCDLYRRLVASAVQ